MSEILPDIGLITPLYHISEVSLVSTSSDQFVGHGLIPLPPWPVWTCNYPVLVGRGDLKNARQKKLKAAILIKICFHIYTERYWTMLMAFA